jgi:hypothetical protein
MNESPTPLRIGRSILAVLAGMIAGVILSLGTDAVLHAAGVFPAIGQPAGDKPLLLATVYRCVYSVFGSYLAARLAPYKPMAHAMVLGVVGFVVCTLGAVFTWNKGPALGPHWYPVALVVTALPCAWLGGLLYRKKQN